MTTIEQLLIFWVLPSLSIFLALATQYRRNGIPLESWTIQNWWSVVFISICYPLGFVIFLIECDWSWLVGER